MAKESVIADVVSNIPMITNDAVVFGILIGLLLFIFKATEFPAFSKFYKVIPALLLCYFLPSLFSTAGIISPKWIDMEGAMLALTAAGFDLSAIHDFTSFKNFVINNEVENSLLLPFIGKSQLYFVASRYMLPASLVLLTLSINLKEVFKLGPKALIMFFTAPCETKL